jgi:hypothetical protein
MRPDLTRLYEQLVEGSKKRGWFFFNARTLEEIEAMGELERLGRIKIDERDVRVDLINNRVQAGEYIGVTLEPQSCYQDQLS